MTFGSGATARRGFELLGPHKCIDGTRMHPTKRALPSSLSTATIEISTVAATRPSETYQGRSSFSYRLLVEPPHFTTKLKQEATAGGGARQGRTSRSRGDSSGSMWYAR